MARLLVLCVAFVAHTDALVVGGAARLQQRRAATRMGLFDGFVNAFMEKEEFDDRSAKGACHLLIRRSLQLSALSLANHSSRSPLLKRGTPKRKARGRL
jgi:hypothetical protein